MILPVLWKHILVLLPSKNSFKPEQIIQVPIKKSYPFGQKQILRQRVVGIQLIKILCLQLSKKQIQQALIL